MPARAQQLILFGLGALVVAALALLAIEASSDQDIEVDESELVRARVKSRQVARSAPAAVRPRAEVAVAKPDDRSDEQQREIFKKPPSIPQPGPANAVRAKGEVTMSPGTEDFVLAMDQANKAYDRGDYMGALESAESLLETQPNNVRMLRIAVSSHCILGNADEAGTFYDRLPARDQRQLSRRCRRYGVEFE
ncbi:MAG: hypothetical protein KJO07_01170 [Deltaproteobacteria bacterium]|jgi:predicted Zn-dependent protease|nr:hypothetical protein [Deltaproteobacteria bacterium]